MAKSRHRHKKRVPRKSPKPLMAEEERFELSVACTTHAFEACSIDRSDTLPCSFDNVDHQNFDDSVVIHERTIIMPPIADGTTISSDRSRLVRINPISPDHSSDHLSVPCFRPERGLFVVLPPSADTADRMHQGSRPAKSASSNWSNQRYRGAHRDTG